MLPTLGNSQALSDQEGLLELRVVHGSHTCLRKRITSPGHLKNNLPKVGARTLRPVSLLQEPLKLTYNVSWVLRTFETPTGGSPTETEIQVHSLVIRPMHRTWKWVVVLLCKPQKTIPSYLLPGVIAVNHTGIEHHPYTSWVVGVRNELSAVC